MSFFDTAREILLPGETTDQAFARAMRETPSILPGKPGDWLKGVTFDGVGDSVRLANEYRLRNED